MDSHHNPSRARSRQLGVMESAAVLESGLVLETVAATEKAAAMESDPASAAAAAASVAVLESAVVLESAAVLEWAARPRTPCRTLCRRSCPPVLGTTDCNCRPRLRKRGSAVLGKGMALGWVPSALPHSRSRPRCRRNTPPPLARSRSLAVRNHPQHRATRM